MAQIRQIIRQIRQQNNIRKSYESKLNEILSNEISDLNKALGDRKMTSIDLRLKANEFSAKAFEKAKPVLKEFEGATRNYMIKEFDLPLQNENAVLFFESTFIQGLKVYLSALVSETLRERAETRLEKRRSYSGSYSASRSMGQGMEKLIDKSSISVSEFLDSDMIRALEFSGINGQDLLDEGYSISEIEEQAGISLLALKRAERKERSRKLRNRLRDKRSARLRANETSSKTFIVSEDKDLYIFTTELD